jgi:hypothetical protein
MVAVPGGLPGWNIPFRRLKDVPCLILPTREPLLFPSAAQEKAITVRVGFDFCTLAVKHAGDRSVTVSRRKLFNAPITLLAGAVGAAPRPRNTFTGGE